MWVGSRKNKGYWGTRELAVTLPGAGSEGCLAGEVTKERPSCWQRHRLGAKRCEGEGAAPVLGPLLPGGQLAGLPRPGQPPGHRAGRVEWGAHRGGGRQNYRPRCLPSQLLLLGHKSWPPGSQRMLSCVLESFFFSSNPFPVILGPDLSLGLKSSTKRIPLMASAGGTACAAWPGDHVCDGHHLLVPPAVQWSCSRSPGESPGIAFFFL